MTKKKLKKEPLPNWLKPFKVSIVLENEDVREEYEISKCEEVHVDTEYEHYMPYFSVNKIIRDSGSLDITIKLVRVLKNKEGTFYKITTINKPKEIKDA